MNYPSIITTMASSRASRNSEDCDREFAGFVLEQASAVDNASSRKRKALKELKRSGELPPGYASAPLADELSDGSDSTEVTDLTTSFNDSSSAAVTATSTLSSSDTFKTAFPPRPPSALFAAELKAKHEAEKAQKEIARLKTIVEDCYRSMIEIQENAAAKQRKLELEVNYLRKVLADANAKVSKVVLLNQSLQTLAREAAAAPGMESVRKTELERERHLTKLLQQRKQVSDENYVLKKLLLSTCQECRSKLRVKTTALPAVSTTGNANSVRFENVQGAPTSSAAPPASPAPTSPSSARQRLRPTYQSTARGALEDLKKKPSTPKGTATPPRSILKTTSTSSAATTKATNLGLPPAPWTDSNRSVKNHNDSIRSLPTVRTSSRGDSSRSLPVGPRSSLPAGKDSSLRSLPARSNDSSRSFSSRPGVITSGNDSVRSDLGDSASSIYSEGSFASTRSLPSSTASMDSRRRAVTPPPTKGRPRLSSDRRPDALGSSSGHGRTTSKTVQTVSERSTSSHGSRASWKRRLGLQRENSQAEF